MKRLTREQILAYKPKQREIDVPEWGGSVVIRELTVAQQEAIATAKNNVDAGLKVFLEGVIEPRFEASDYDALRNLGAGAMERVLTAILDLSGMSKDVQRDIQKK